MASVTVALCLLWSWVAGRSAPAQAPASVSAAPDQVGATPLPVARTSFACEDDNPYFAISLLFPAGDGAFEQLVDSVSAVRDTESSDFRNNYFGLPKLALHGDVGAVFGLAYDWRRHEVLSSAHHSFQKFFGPGGVGAIYRTNLDTGITTIMAQLPAGDDHHGRRRGLYDYESAPWVGKVSLGDIDINDDASLLFVANLHDRRIYVLSLPTGDVVGSFPHGAANEVWSDDARPFGLGYRKGWLYHGVVDSQESRQASAPRGYIYRSRDDGSDMELVAEIAFASEHRPPWAWWHDVIDPHSSAQPIIADIDFRLNGDMIIGIRNRVVDMHEVMVAGGDILLAEKRAGQAQYVVSDNKFYQDELPVAGGETRADAIIGGLASFERMDWVVVTGHSFWPGEPGQGGGFPADAALWFSNRTGLIEGPNQGVEWLLSDIFGEGDIELLCGPEVVTTPTASSTPTPSAASSATASLTPSSSSPTASVTSTVRPTATSSPSSTPEGRYIYLPLVLRPCKANPAHVDVAVVIDRSTSMLRPISDGDVPKNEAAIRAVGEFSSRMSLLGNDSNLQDRLAIVGFNDSAWTELGLSGDRQEVGRALESIKHKTAEGTRLDLAFREGADVFDRDKEATRAAVMILLTDGLPNRVPHRPGSSQEAAVLAAAAEAKNSGILVFTIGIGKPDDVNLDLLATAASEPSMAYYAADSEDIGTIYHRIADRTAGCP